MKLFDTHCHFETCDETAIAASLRRARAAGVEALMAVGGSETLNASALLAAEMAENSLDMPKVYVATGLDRDQATRIKAYASSLEMDQPALSIAAIGEIGLDYHYSPETRDAQMKLFMQQLEEARERNLPVVVHTRDAAADTIAVLREIPSRGIIHCFTGGIDEARAYLDLGFFVSISGIVTFSAANNVREMAKLIPDDRVLIETDAPFLAPVPMRGNANEPAHIRYTCEYFAALRGASSEQFAELTFDNAEKALGL